MEGGLGGGAVVRVHRGGGGFHGCCCWGHCHFGWWLVCVTVRDGDDGGCDGDVANEMGEEGMGDMRHRDQDIQPGLKRRTKGHQVLQAAQRELLISNRSKAVTHTQENSRK